MCQLHFADETAVKWLTSCSCKMHTATVLSMHDVCVCSGNGNYLTAEQFMWFLNQEQRDPRLNEILYPYCDIAKARSLISKFEPDDKLAQAGCATYLSGPVSEFSSGFG